MDADTREKALEELERIERMQTPEVVPLEGDKYLIRPALPIYVEQTNGERVTIVEGPVLRSLLDRLSQRSPKPNTSPPEEGR